MRDNFELIDLSAYLIGMMLILPAGAALERNSAPQLALMIVLLAPLPVHLLRLRGTYPDWLDRAVEKHAYGMLFVGIFVFLGIIGFRFVKWVF